MSSEKEKIPNGKKGFFKISKSLDWNFAIAVEFNCQQEIDELNLFLILKAFILNREFPCFAVYVTYKNIDGKIFVSHNLDFLKLKKISFYEFANWYEWIVSNDKHYDKKDSFVSFLIVFEKEIIKLKQADLSLLKPKYPWTETFLNKVAPKSEDAEFLKKEIITLKEKVNKLEKMLITEKKKE